MDCYNKPFFEYFNFKILMNKKHLKRQLMSYSNVSIFYSKISELKKIINSTHSTYIVENFYLNSIF